MGRENVYDDTNRLVGWVEQIGTDIHYYTYKYGEIGQFDTRTKQYRRWKTRPGQPVCPFAGTDYGMSDLLYWAAN